ncbi:amidase [Gemmatimonas phototrophica]|uniref:Amidase n=1 Tax=Gemmatimonas phototrophica TaxID=1379270 RepID=A0A143BH21_9BACT|nr:amidase [Gemmatimonas phototrophica]AMW03893.1 amidase [Gemmatimonas phototrophica]
MSDGFSRRGFLATSSVAAAGLAVGASAAPAEASSVVENAPDQPKPFAFDEATVGELTARMQRGSLTSRALTAAYLERIAAVDRAGPTLRSVIEVNPDALRIAEERDAERRAGTIRGVLHGIPVLVKDNLDTGDRMQTTAGSRALVGTPASADSTVVAKLRAAGAVLLGKTNLSEWANFRSTRSTSGWSGRGGQTKHPYVLDRNPCGSSSGTGTAIAANLATVGIGTETDGSIICPSSICGLVGLKPTVGLVSRAGIVPISVSQDTAGPMTRTVTDAALVLSVIRGRDERDAATVQQTLPTDDYVKALRPTALEGARLGVSRNMAGFHPAVDAAFNAAIAVLRAAGAVIIDPCNVPTVGKYDAAELEVLLYEFKDGLNAYLASRGDTVKYRTLEALMAYNTEHAAEEMPWFAQELFEQAHAKGTLSDAAYQEALQTCRRLSRDEGLDALFAQHQLSAVIAPSNGPSWTTDWVNGDRYSGGNSSVAAVAGYPSLTVPMAYTAGLPLGLSFIGTAYTESTLLGLGYAFEQKTKARRVPTFVRSLS